MSSFEVSGFDKLEEQLKQLEKNVHDLCQTTNVSFDELFPVSFMQKHSSFSSLDDLFSAGGFTLESQEDFEAIPDDELNKHILTNTEFKTWEDMLNEATAQYATKKLGF